jgi:hypothetical protein
VTLAQPMPPQFRHFEAALNPNADEGHSFDDVRSTFERFLRQEKSRYESAIELINQS